MGFHLLGLAAASWLVTRDRNRVDLGGRCVGPFLRPAGAGSCSRLVACFPPMIRWGGAELSPFGSATA